MLIGLSIAFKGQNYGQLLQAYATQTILEKMGHMTEIIDYQRDGIKGIRFTPWLVFYIIEKSLKRHQNQINHVALDELHEKNLIERKEAARNFRKRRFKNVIKVNGNKELVELGKKYDAALVGSDQCWLPESCFGNIRTLRFVPDNVRKVSYATSLGVSEYPFYCRSSARQFLKRFDYISVREEQGKKIVEGLCDKKVEVVLDPTYLLTKLEWEHLIPNNREIDEDYLLCFFIGNNKQSKEIAAEFGRKKRLKIISILSDESVSDIDETFADQIIVGASPERFVNYIRNASYVMTDSFHGVAFSVINEKQFYVFYRHSTTSAGSRNSRIDNILATWNLKDRLINEGRKDSLGKKEIDYSLVGRIIEKRRSESLRFLENALR